MESLPSLPDWRSSGQPGLLMLYWPMSEVFIGTSGWYYKQWHKTFYPKGLSKPKQLPYYATVFPTVEINASFYKLLTQKTVAGWTAKVPSDFIFAVKGSRFITHMKKLTDVTAALVKFFDSIRGFGEVLGPILWQLPPFLQRDDARLKNFWMRCRMVIDTRLNFAIAPGWPIRSWKYWRTMAPLWFGSVRSPCRAILP